MSEQQYNVDLLMQVREKIVNEPEKHHQGDWASASEDPREGGEECGTAYCVAGWAAVLDGQALAWSRLENGSWTAGHLAGDEVRISAYAQEALGLSDGERNRLFAGGSPRPEVLDRLDRLIEAGKNGERLPWGTL